MMSGYTDFRPVRHTPLFPMRHNALNRYSHFLLKTQKNPVLTGATGFLMLICRRQINSRRLCEFCWRGCSWCRHGWSCADHWALPPCIFAGWDTGRNGDACWKSILCWIYCGVFRTLRKLLPWGGNPLFCFTKFKCSY